MKPDIEKSFGDYFKKLRLQSGIATLHELGEKLSSHGFIYEDSILSHWQHGRKLPKKREIYLTLLTIFVAQNTYLSVDMCNMFLDIAEQRYLTEEEIARIGLIRDKKIESLHEKHDTVKAYWYQRMAQDYIIIFSKYISGDVASYNKIHESYDIMLDIINICIINGFCEETIGLWNILKTYLWENAYWEAYNRLAKKIEIVLAEKGFEEESLQIILEDLIFGKILQERFLEAYELLRTVEEHVMKSTIYSQAIHQRQLGIIFFHYGKFSKAIQSFEKALFLFKKMNKTKEMTQMALYIGNVYEYSHHLSDAEGWYKKYLPLVLKEKLLEHASSYELHLSRIYHALGEHSKAKEYFDNSFIKEEELKRQAGKIWRTRFSDTAIQTCLSLVGGNITYFPGEKLSQNTILGWQ